VDVNVKCPTAAILVRKPQISPFPNKEGATFSGVTQDCNWLPLKARLAVRNQSFFSMNKKASMFKRINKKDKQFRQLKIAKKH
jgi:hypothetical protein